jgi:chemotaxis protein CheD
MTRGAVRMGEMAVSRSRSDELVALGLGSCIGLALVDRSEGVAGLAHIMLPESQERTEQPGKYANRAVPELIELMRMAGANERRLEAVLAGGACMFELGNELDIGARNELAVREALARARVAVAAAATGGKRGRTVRVLAREGTVTVKEAGGATVTLLSPRSNGTEGER